MPLMPDTFCPAKWNEIVINLNHNYAYACCKATPLKFVKDIKEIIEPQKQNLLNGSQDSSCNYCWRLENQGLPSLRKEYLKNFDHNTFEQYQTNSVDVGKVEVHLGNECNFQCTYCNPKFSSQWAADRPYKTFSDRKHFEIEPLNRVDQTDDNLSILKDFGKVRRLNLMGGETLLNKNLFNILDSADVDEVFISTNFSSATFKPIDRLISAANNFKKLNIGISLDSTGENAEFTRYGLDFALLERNLTYLINNITPNIQIVILSLMTSVTVRDLPNFVEFIKTYKKKYPKLVWRISYCITPVTQSFDTLHDKYKPEILELVQQIKLMPDVEGADILESAIVASKFNNILYQQLKHFLNEFSTRKGIQIPVCLD